MNDMRQWMTMAEGMLTEARSPFTLPDNVFEQAIAHLDSSIDWGGGNGETVIEYMRELVDDPYASRDEPEGSVDFEKMDKETFNAIFRRWAAEAIHTAFETIRPYVKNGKIRVWREITAPNDWTPNGRHPGLYWSYEKGAAEAHWGSVREAKWLIEAIVRVDQINWAVTLAANANPDYESEKEIRLKGETVPVQIVRYRRVG